METIGIIAAMSQERDALLHLIEHSKRSSLGSFRCDRFQVAGRDCLLVTSGMGIKRAAQAALALVHATRPQLLVSVGVAGAVNSDLEIGDVVAARNTCQLDKGTLCEFIPLALLSDASRLAASQALQLRQARLVIGSAVTTRGSQFIQGKPAELTNPILEMETTGIARVSDEQGIPLLSIRAISDGPQAPIPFDLDEMMDEQDNLRIGRIIIMMLRHPQVLVQFLRMGRNTRKAAENAAIALVATLSQPGSLILQR